MKRSKSCGLIVLGLAVNAAQGAEALQSSGKLEAVTVYRGQALVTRLMELAGPAGLREVVVTELPPNVVPDSIYAESAEGVEVRSVRYRTSAVSQDVREDVRKLDEQIQELQTQMETSRRHTALLAEHKTYLDQLQQFTAPTAALELTRGVLNAETLKSLTTFQFEQRRILAEEELKLGREQKSLTAQLELLQHQRERLTSSSSRVAREAVVFLEQQKADAGSLRLRYLVNNASWTPSYNVRAESDRKQVSIEYNALIQQMSGEDWNDVTMTLSTATPSLVAKAPTLNPLSVMLTSAANNKAPGEGIFLGGDYLGAQQELAQRRQSIEQARQQPQPQPQPQQQAAPVQPGMKPTSQANFDFDLSLNTLAGEWQLFELVNPSKVTRPTKKATAKAGEGVSITYQLSSHTSLPSRSDQQLIQIVSMPMKAEFYKLAIPVLTSYVYEEAAVVNEGQAVLLAGPVSTYLAGQFVGQGDIPTVAVGEQFTIGFGIDSSLRATRELVNKSETFQGGNRLVDFTYRLAIENFSSAPANVRLLDRLPTAKESEVKLTLVSTKQELSADTAYQQTERKKGILRWEVQVPPQAAGPQAFGIEYELRLEYDKQMTLGGLATASR